MVGSVSVVAGSGCSVFISSLGDDDSDLGIVVRLFACSLYLFVNLESFDAWMLSKF